MASLATVRAAAATALSGVSGYTVTARPSKATPKPKDGWLTIGRVVPEDYSHNLCTLTAVICLGTDEVLAETTLETDASALVSAITDAQGILIADLFLEPALIVTGTNSAPYYAALLTFTVEVD